MNLKRILSKLHKTIPPEGTHLGFLFEKLTDKAYFIFVLLLCVPFIQPVPLPGVSTVIGLLISLLGLYIAFKQGKPPHLPHRIFNKHISYHSIDKLLHQTVKVLTWLEKKIKPKAPWKKNKHTYFIIHGLWIAFNGFLLSLPLPIPFSNSLPAWSCLLMALAHIEENESLLWIAYGLASVTILFFAIVFGFFYESFEWIVIHP